MIDLIVLLLFGLVVGVFVNYLTDVLPYKRKLTKPICVHCQETLSWKETLLFKDCTNCNGKRSIRSKIVLVAFPILFALLWKYPIGSMSFWLEALMVTYLSVVAITDLEYRLILQPVSIIGIPVGLLVGINLHGVWVTLLGGVIGFALMLGLYFLGLGYAKYLQKRRGEAIEEVALGFGDVNLSGVLGLMLGWPGISAGLIIAILLAGGYSILYILIAKLLKSYHPFTAIPYAPFLIISALFLLFRP